MLQHHQDPVPFLSVTAPLSSSTSLLFFASTATWCLSLLDCTDSNATRDHTYTAMLTQSTPSTPGPDVFPHFGENTLELERERVHKGRRTCTTRPHNLSPHQFATVANARRSAWLCKQLRGNGISSSSSESQCQTPCTCVDVRVFSILCVALAHIPSDHFSRRWHRTSDDTCAPMNQVQLVGPPRFAEFAVIERL